MFFFCEKHFKKIEKNGKMKKMRKMKNQKKSFSKQQTFHTFFYGEKWKIGKVKQCWTKKKSVQKTES